MLSNRDEHFFLPLAASESICVLLEYRLLLNTSFFPPKSVIAIDVKTIINKQPLQMKNSLKSNYVLHFPHGQVRGQYCNETESVSP